METITMMIKRKTTSKHVTLRGKVTIVAAPSADILPGNRTPPTAIPDPRHMPRESTHSIYTPKLYPELTLKIPGIGEIIITPAEVAAIEDAIETARAQAYNGGNYNGRELSRSF